MIGTIRDIQPEKQIGFILCPGRTVFYFHQSDIPTRRFSTELLGLDVQFTPIASDLVPRAANVVPFGGASEVTPGKPMRGIVKSLRFDKGFGFIEPAEPGDDYFFHVSQLRGGLEFDDQLYQREVIFEVQQAEPRPRAINVRPWEHAVLPQPAPKEYNPYAGPMG